MSRPGAVAALLLGVPALLPAQTPRDTVRLPALVVTATRLPTARDAVPNAVTVLDGAELERRGITRVADALRLVPGVTIIQSGSPGAVTSLFLRGGENDFVRVLVDGVPANQPGGTINLADLTTADVERIEVVRGPASALYGSDAVSGVIQVFTRRGAGPLHASARVRGTEHGHETSADLAGGTPRAGFSLGGSRAALPGVYRFNSRYDGWSAGGLVRAAPDERSEVQLAVRHQGGSYHYPTDFSGAPVDSNQFTSGRLTTASLEAGRLLAERADLRLQLGLAAGTDRAVNRADSATDFNVYDVGTPYGRRSADVRVNLRTAARGVVTFGGAVESERFRGAGDTVDLTRGNRALYAQLLGPAGGSRAMITAGARLEDNERFGRVLTVRGGVSAPLGAWTTVRASAGTGFKEPTFYENYGGGYSIGNPDLAPERTLSGEVGIERRLAGGAAVVGLTAFAQQFDSLIQYAPGGPAGSPQYHNLAGARARGLELDVRSAPWRGAALALGWTWLHTEVVEPGAGGAAYADHRPLVRRPAHSGSLSLDQFAGTVSGGLTVLYVGRREDLDYRTDFTGVRAGMPSYLRVDARFAWHPAGRLGVTLDATNALGAAYAEALGFPARGRTVWVGMTWGAP